jgi:hypothetical protein
MIAKMQSRVWDMMGVISLVLLSCHLDVRTSKSREESIPELSKDQAPVTPRDSHHATEHVFAVKSFELPQRLTPSCPVFMQVSLLTFQSCVIFSG